MGSGTRSNTSSFRLNLRFPCFPLVFCAKFNTNCAEINTKFVLVCVILPILTESNRRTQIFLTVHSFPLSWHRYCWTKKSLKEYYINCETKETRALAVVYIYIFLTHLRRFAFFTHLPSSPYFKVLFAALISNFATLPSLQSKL